MPAAPSTARAAPLPEAAPAMATGAAAPAPERVATDWADPGFFTKEAPRHRQWGRVMWQLLEPPKGHRTIPTRTGLVLISLSVGLGGAAYNTSSNILFIMLSLLLSCLVLSGILSWLNFQGCRWRLLTEPHLRAGEPSPVIVELTNTKRWLPTVNLGFELVSALAPKAKHRVPQAETAGPGQTIRIEWLYTPPRRGWEKLRLDRLGSLYPFGFLHKSLPGEAERAIAVWPARVAYRFVPQTSGHLRQTGVGSHRTDGGTELTNLREYAPGDPLRSIHWKASARTKRLMVREMSEENRENFLLYVETPASRWQEGPQFEKLCSAAASLAEDLFKDGRLRAAAVNGEPIVYMRKLPDLHLFLEQLARLTPVAGSPSLHDGLGVSQITVRPGPNDTIAFYVGGQLAGSA